MRRIEDEIKQKNFKNNYQKVIVNIFFTNNWLIEKQINTFKLFEITIQQYNILRILRGQYPVPATINLLIDRMLNKLCDASRLVEKLRLKKLVERVQSPHDRRAVNVVITDKGLELLKKVDPLVETTNVKLSKNLTDEEAVQLNYLLDKLRQP